LTLTDTVVTNTILFRVNYCT